MMPSFIEPIKTFSSPHFSPSSISVEFLIIHYTAQSLQGSLNIFLSKNEKVSCHLLIDEKGEIYELVKCWKQPCQRAFHAGKSLWKDSSGNTWENFNLFSIGIELVNFNGNLFSYTEKQYEALFKVVEHLKTLYPNLKKPYRILGHEHIAGFRGKSDPGFFFDWKRLYKVVYSEKTCDLLSQITEQQVKSLQFCQKLSCWNDSIARQVSLIFEKPLPFWIKKLLIRKIFQAARFSKN